MSLDNQLILETAKATIKLEYDAIAQLASFIDDDFAEIVHKLHASKGRVVITGIGKSAIIAQKIAATMNSTGTPALFMHAADAIHGDLGMIQSDDHLIIISKSGESPEIKALVPLVKNFGNTIIALCGNMQSYLALHSDHVINSTVATEACPNNLAPTTSTTAQMVMGDAIAICLLKLKGFTAQDFAKYHPGGALGKRLYLHVSTLMEQHDMPAVPHNASLKTIIIEISSKRLGATAVLDNKRALQGIITDGDLRRMLATDRPIESITAEQIMTKSPKTIAYDALAVEALQVMKRHNITQLPVMNGSAYVGIVHLHDLIREGII